MGRRKITIRQIVDPKLRHITFNKRKNGLIKKAAELSLLCNVNMLLIFEDGNGNLIQFSKNKLTSIPAFFQECRYNNLVEFVAKDYPTFFKVNHYKKHKEKEMEDFDDEDFDIETEETAKSSFGQNNKSLKRDRPQGHIKEEAGHDSPKIIYQSEDSVNDDIDDVSLYSESQPTHYMLKNPIVSKPKPKVFRTEDKLLRPVMNREDINSNLVNEQEIPSQPKEAFQPYREMNARPIRDEKSIEYPPQYLGFEQSFKRAIPTPDAGNSQFRFYSAENANLNVVSAAANPFVNAQNYSNAHPYIHNSHAYPTAPNNFQANKPANRLRGFGNINMSHMANEETLNAMLKGFNPLNFAMGGNNPFIPKPSGKSEMDDKMLDTANMIKYLNGTSANSFSNQKLYGFNTNEIGKPEEAETLNHLRSRQEHENVAYDHEQEYHELPQYVRGEYRVDPSNMPANLPSAYFSSKKFNFDGYFNTFEDDRFNEFADSKRKMKQSQ